MIKTEKLELTRRLTEVGFEVSRVYRINRRWIVTERVEVIERGNTTADARATNDRLYAFLEAYDPKTNWETTVILYTARIAEPAPI